MALRSLRLFPDPLLYQESRPVTDYGKSLKDLLQDLIDTLARSPGVGLAAPQIGVLKRVSIIDVSRIKAHSKAQSSYHGIIVLINPVLTDASGTQIPREGCLSVPDWLASVKRFQEVTVRTETLEGGQKTIKSHGFEALALQHEIDHLKGKLFLDRVVDVKTDLFRRKTYR